MVGSITITLLIYTALIIANDCIYIICLFTVCLLAKLNQVHISGNHLPLHAQLMILVSRKLIVFFSSSTSLFHSLTIRRRSASSRFDFSFSYRISRLRRFISSSSLEILSVVEFTCKSILFWRITISNLTPSSSAANTPHEHRQLTKDDE